MESAQKAGLYIAVKDYSNPGPNGGLALDNAQPDNQSYAFVTAPNFPQGQMMLVTYPRIDYKLRMSDRKCASDSQRRIIETIHTQDGEIAQGKSLDTPSSDFLWQVEKKDGNIIVFSAHDDRAIDVYRARAEVGIEVSGYPKHCGINQQWKFQNPLS